jgi:hypothetical protein
VFEWNLSFDPMVEWRSHLMNKMSLGFDSNSVVDHAGLDWEPT